MITVLAGGVGAARFLLGLTQVVPAADITAIVNTADDTVMHGLYICPDLDTVTYTLAGAIDRERGWGLRDESWRAMEALARFVPARPQSSNAAPTWFNLGDQDLATHFYRTARLAEGASLSEVAGEIAHAFGLHVRILPMSDQRVETRVTIVGEGEGEGEVEVEVEVSFQEYFVKRHHDVAISAVRFIGAEQASLTGSAARALMGAHAIVIAPSNPIVSIGPIRALSGVDAALSARRQSVVAISPIVGGAALKGPADRMLRELGHEASVVGVARLYASIASALVIDPVDAHLARQVEAAGMRAVVIPSVMSTPEISAELSRTVLDAAGVAY